MPDMNIDTGSGGTATIAEATIRGLQESLRGKLLTQGNTEYDEARKIWNAMIDRRPALIVRATSTRDVSQAVRFAAENNLKLAVRGGGHNIAGNAVCDGGVMIDLSLMNTVTADATTRRLRTGGGARLADVDAAAQAFGLVVPVGINSTTGIAGLTLGGGFGWLSRSLGLTIDSLLSAEVVTASGQVITASATENSDLFWGLRGGGGNFGVVTEFEFRMHEIGKEVFAGLVVHPLDDAPKVLREYRKFTASLPDNVACWFVLRMAPPLPFLPEEWHGRHVLAFALCATGPANEAERIVKPLRDIGSPVGEHVGSMPYIDWQQILDPMLTPGERNYWKTHYFDTISDGLIDTLVEQARLIPDPQTEIAWAQLGGAVARFSNTDTPYPRRDAQFVLNVHGRWSDASIDQKCIGWARGLFDATQPFASAGAYVNFMTEEEGDRVQAAYGANYTRLADLKTKYDPKNVFRMNQNIRPKGK